MKKYPDNEFHCNCVSCGKLPEQEKSPFNLWIEVSEGMLCEECWKKRTELLDVSRIPVENHHYESEVFCCFCILCGRTPPDPEIKIWVETTRGCLCEVCLKRVAGEGLVREIQKIREGQNDR